MMHLRLGFENPEEPESSYSVPGIEVNQLHPARKPDFVIRQWDAENGYVLVKLTKRQVLELAQGLIQVARDFEKGE